jgi:hypothetical protein
MKAPGATEMFAQFDGSSEAETDAVLELLTIAPTTAAWLAALLQYIGDEGGDDYGGCGGFFARNRHDVADAANVFFPHLAAAARAILGA